MSDSEKLFSLDNILTISARDYCESVGKKLSNYHLVPVHAIVNGNGDINFCPDIRVEFAKNVPKTA